MRVRQGLADAGELLKKLILEDSVLIHVFNIMIEYLRVKSFIPLKKEIGQAPGNCPGSNASQQFPRTPLLERLATKLGCRASWKNERLFRRPKKEDRRGRREGDAQDRGRPHLRRGHLLGQALRGELP